MQVTDQMKSFDLALFAAFKAGAAFGARYPEADSWPVVERNLQWRAFRDDWVGNTWDEVRWREERARVLAQYEERNFDPEPQPGDGPEYHADHQAWRERQARVRTFRGAEDQR